MRFIWMLAALAIGLSLGSAAGASGATLHLVGSFDQPIFVTSSPANPNDLFVAERKGRVVQVDEGVAGTLADLSGLISCCESERGLLSIAPAPDFGLSGRFYAAYTGKPAAGGAEGDLHVDAFRQDGGTLLREPILTIGHAVNANHNGGQLQFGPDGYLYISTGDGGGGGDPLGSGQDVNSLLGKILRIDPRPGDSPAYAVPPGNPFVGQPGLDEIWSYGLRNPWRFSFDRAGAAMAIGDVGQGEHEEIDLAPSPAAGAVGGAAANYGWNCREGFSPYVPAGCAQTTGFTDPVFDYPHTAPVPGGPRRCSITGGYVVRDPSLGDLYGRYLYADFCIGEIRSLVLPSSIPGLADDDRSEGLNVPEPTSFGEDSCGRLYVASKGGQVYRFDGATPSVCTKPPPAPPGSPTPTSEPAPTPGQPPAGTQGDTRVHLETSARQAKPGARVLLTATVSPCAGQAGTTVQLNRGGHRVAAKPLDADCVARFRRRIDRRSTFRALLPAAGYRSQVLMIALAKPSP